MRNKDVEKLINDSFTEMNPDLFSKILENCPKMNDTNYELSFWKKIQNLLQSKKFAYSFSSFILVLSISLFMFIQPNSIDQRVFSVIAIDVNPSVVLELNDEDKVINVIMKNEDAIIIVGDMDLINVDYNIAVNALIGSMVANGYLDEFKNSVLISIRSDDMIHEDELKTEVTQAVYNYLSNSAINGSIITQEYSEDDAIKLLAERLGISEAKAELIFEITMLDPRVTVEELALLSINDLNVYLESKNYSIDKIDKVGKASELEYLSENEAFQIALTELGIDEINITEYEIELEQEDGVMVYELKIKTISGDFEVLVNAKDGTIVVENENDEDDEDDEDDDQLPTEVLSESEVLSLVLLELGIVESEITDLEIEQDQDGGIYFYEIEFEYQDQSYKLDVDAISGNILTNSQDETGYDYKDDDDDKEEDDEDDED